MAVTRPRRTRIAVLAGTACATAALGLLVPGTASAAVGQFPGHLALAPASGAIASQPTWSTDTACSGSFNSAAKLYVVPDPEIGGDPFAVSGTVTPVTSPFSGTLQGPLSFIVSAGGLQPGHTYEFVVMCQTVDLVQHAEQSKFLTISADGNSYTTSDTPPAPTSGAVTTHTTLTANPASAAPGADVTLAATVSADDTAAGDAAGSVEFFYGSTSLGSTAVSGGTASLVTNSLPIGANSVTAKFIPADADAFGASTSSAVTVTIGTAGGNSETINVNIPQQQSGSLTLTVDNTPVTMSAPQNVGTSLESTGDLAPVTVTDSRTPTKPGWDTSGSVSDFTSGANSFSGDSLGWTPKVVTPNQANDVTPGAAIAAGDPGIKTAAGLASAAATKGAGTTVLGAGLDLQVPVTTPAGSYSATLTLTLLSK